MSIPSFHLPGPLGDAADAIRNEAADAAATIRSGVAGAEDAVRGAATTVENHVRTGLADAAGRVEGAATSISQRISGSIPASPPTIAVART